MSLWNRLGLSANGSHPPSDRGMPGWIAGPLSLDKGERLCFMGRHPMPEGRGLLLRQLSIQVQVKPMSGRAGCPPLREWLVLDVFNCRSNITAVPFSKRFLGVVTHDAPMVLDAVGGLLQSVAQAVVGA